MKTDNTLYTHHQNNNEFETEENKTEKILLRRKLVLLVSCMLIIGVGYYTFMNFPYMAAYTTMRTTGWTVIFNAPEQELTGGTTKKLMTMFIITNLCLLITLFTITRIVIRKMI